jgi:hypothetical protein
MTQDCVLVLQAAFRCSNDKMLAQKIRMREKQMRSNKLGNSAKCIEAKCIAKKNEDFVIWIYFV